MRRTKPTLIYRRTKNLRAVPLLLGHSKLESTVRYPGVYVNDALEIAEQTEIYSPRRERPVGDERGRSLTGHKQPHLEVADSRRPMTLSTIAGPRIKLRPATDWDSLSAPAPPCAPATFAPSARQGAAEFGDLDCLACKRR